MFMRLKNRGSIEPTSVPQIEPIPPNRGLILDRNGLPLATNAPSYQLELTREQVEDIDATLKGLAGLGLLDNAVIPSLKKDIRGRRSKAIVVTLPFYKRPK